MTQLNRRSFVLGLGALAGTVSLAACSSGQQQDATADAGPLVFNG